MATYSGTLDTSTNLDGIQGGLLKCFKLSLKLQLIQLLRLYLCLGQKPRGRTLYNGYILRCTRHIWLTNWTALYQNVFFCVHLWINLLQNVIQLYMTSAQITRTLYLLFDTVNHCPAIVSENTSFIFFSHAIHLKNSCWHCQRNFQ